MKARARILEGVERVPCNLRGPRLRLMLSGQETKFVDWVERGENGENFNRDMKGTNKELRRGGSKES